MSVDDLRDICVALTDGKREYKLTCDDEKTIAIAYNDGPDDLNSICFTFPIIGNLNWPPRIFGNQFPFGEDGLMVCLHTYAGKQVRRGLYFEDISKSGWQFQPHSRAASGWVATSKTIGYCCAKKN